MDSGYRSSGPGLDFQVSAPHPSGLRPATLSQERVFSSKNTAQTVLGGIYAVVKGYQASICWKASIYFLAGTSQLKSWDISLTWRAWKACRLPL